MGFAMWQGSLWHAHHVVHHHSFTGCPYRDPDIYHTRPFLRKHEKHSTKKAMFNVVPTWMVPSICLSIFFIFPGMWLGQSMSYEMWRSKGRIWAMPLPRGEADATMERRKKKQKKGNAGEDNKGRRYNYLTAADALPGLSRGFLAPALGLVFLLSQVYAASPLLSIVYTIAMNAAYAAMIFPDHDTMSTYENEVVTPMPPHVRDRKRVEDGSSDDESDTEEEEKRTDWGEVQIRHSGNFGGKLDCLLFGGINYQIEHHLFPSISHQYLPQVAEIVKEECARSNVPYVHHSSLYAAIKDYFVKMSALNGQSSGNEEPKQLKKKLI